MDNLDKIFKAYDVRGVYPDELNEELAYKICRAAARFLIIRAQTVSFKLRTKQGEPLLVGRDNRSSSENLSKVVIDAIRNEGVDVIDIGLTTTPMFYFTVIKWKLRGGIMITASHNPSEYNGLKFVQSKAMPVGEKGLKEIKEMAGKIKIDLKIKRGKLEKREILRDYINHIFNFVYIDNIRSFKMVVDTANGTAGMVVPELFEHVPLKLIHIFGELDGSFPNHNPNPSNPENTKKLQEKVLSSGADLGVAFDGDGDRILFIDERGERIDPDLIAAVLVHYYFKNAGNILCTAISSKNLREEIEDSNNNLIFSRVGHTFVKKKLKEENAVFGSEPSGHYYLEANYFIESPFIVLLKILEIISRTKMPLSELVKQFQAYYREEINKKLKNDSDAVRITKKIEKTYKKNGKISRIDGLTIEFTDWWFNLRPSNTEPVIRLTIEAQTKELLEQKKKELNEFLKS